MKGSEVDLKKELNQWLEPFWQTATPGLALEVYSKGKNVFSYQGGQTYPYYDLASLTKVLFTTPAMMMAYQQKLWTLDSLVQEYLPWWPHPQTKIIHLLSHTSGLIWWKPFYEGLVKISGLQDRWGLLKEELKNANLELTSKAVYSDVGFLTLAFILESLWSMPLLKIWELWQNENVKNTSLHWIALDPLREPVRRFPLNHYAPTEVCPWRGRRIQGEVHDENAWSLGGVSTHAGLFGSVKDVSNVFLFYRQAYLNESHPWHPTLKLFTQRQIPEASGDWALGFMMPTVGGSSSGHFFSPQSIGHTGFTGTSVWWDPERDFIVALLSNRLFYGRSQREFAKLRPLLHDKLKIFSEV